MTLSPVEEWEVIEGCHEAIVTPEEWEQVQEIIDRRPTIMKGNACPFYNLFHGLGLLRHLREVHAGAV